MSVIEKTVLFKRRQRRVRHKLRMVSNDCVRLTVYRSNRNIAAQIIDDRVGRTIVSASSQQSELGLKHGNNREAAAKVGALIAKRATEAGIEKCFLDRGGHLYHGRVKALADAARAGGLKF